MYGKSRIVKWFGWGLAVAALLINLPATQVQAQAGVTWSVCLEGTCDYHTIQGAINAAGVGDTIEVSAGTYNYETEGSPEPAGLIKITKPLTIKAAEGARPVIDGTGFDGVFKIWATTFTGGEVVIEGFEITGNATTDIAITAPMHDPEDPTKIIIRDNVIHGMNGGIDLWGSGNVDAEKRISNVEITDNEFYDLGQDGAVGFGIMLEDLKSDNEFAAVVERNLFRDIHDSTTESGVGIVIPRADAANGEAVNLSIADNTFENTVSVGLAVLAGDVASAEIVDNLFDGAGLFIADDNTSSGPINAFPNWWGSGAGPEAGQVVGSAKYNPWCYTADCTELYVAETGSIQDAIDAASAGGTIHVAAGTYTEHITIAKQLQLIGENKDTTIIDGSATGVVVTIQAADVRFSGFTVKNSGSDEQTEAGIGVLGVGGVTISDNILRDNANGVALAAASNNLIEDNVFENNHIGVAMEGYPDANTPSETNTIRDNEINNSTHSGIWGGQNCNGNSISSNTITSSIGAADGVYLWKSSGNTITGNTITDQSQYGIHLFGSNENELTRNTIAGNLDGIRIRVSGWPEGEYPSFPNTIEKNKISGNSQYELFAEAEATSINASSNWWGSAGGPDDDQIVGDVTFTPWCGDEDCATTLPNDQQEIELPSEATEEDVQNAINNAPSGATVVVPSGSYVTTGGFVINSSGVTVYLKKGVNIRNNSPCFVVTANDVTVKAETLGSATCVPTNGSNGVDVNADLANITIEGFEIDGSGQTTGDGINFAGAATNVTIRDMFIHDLTGDGIDFASVQPAGTVEIKGNLFMDNGGVGIRNDAGTSELDATYNAWGDVAGPAGAEGDGVGANVTYTPWTHVDLYMESSGTTTPDEVESTEQITYTVYANLENATGMTITLKYPPAYLTYVETETVLSGTFDAETLTPNLGEGTLTFQASNSVGSESGESVALFSVTFEAGETMGTYLLDLDETTDAFTMDAGSGLSDNIYAARLVDSNVSVSGEYKYIFPVFFH